MRSDIAHPDSVVAGGGGQVPQHYRGSLLEAIDAARDAMGMKAHAVAALRLTSPDEADAQRSIERRYGYNRHRAEQAEASALQAADAATGCLRAVRASLGGLAAAMPRPPGDLGSEPWARGLSPCAAARVAAAQGGIHVVDVPGAGPAMVPFTPDAWSRALAAYAEGLPERGDLPRRVAASLDMPDEARGACARALAMAQAGGSAVPVLAACGRWDLVADAVLPPGGPAVDRERVAGRLAREVPGAPDPAWARAFLSEWSVEPRPGLHASRKEAGRDPSEGRALAYRCETAAANGPPGRAWTADDLAAAVGDASGVDDALRIERALVAHGTLARRAGGGWSLRDRRRAPGAAHLLAEDILVREGRPMPASELRARLRGGSGVAPLAGGWIDGRLVETSKDIVGLVDRDLPIDIAEAGDLVATVRRLVDREGLRWSALPGALSGKPYAGRLPGPEALKSLLKVHGGLAVAQGGRIQGVPAPRVTASRATARIVVEALSASKGGLRWADAVRAVRDATGAEPDADAVEYALRKYAARTTASPDVWKIRPGVTLRRDRGDGASRGRHVYPCGRLPAKGRGAYDWTDERVAILRRLAAEGAGSRRIIEALGGGVTKSAVVCKARRMGLVVGPPSGAGIGFWTGPRKRSLAA